MYTQTAKIFHTHSARLLSLLTLLAGCSTHGSECQQNLDCTDSSVARSPLKCRSWEVYCLDQQCKAACGDECVVIRADRNPCSTGICRSSLVAGDPYGYCTMLPISCQTAEDCPKYLPPLPDGGQSSWTCENETCVYPGFVNPTN
jgi:hypothetical protein